MNIYLIARDENDNYGTYDTNLRHVIIADTEDDARRQAALAACDEPSWIWCDANETKASLIGTTVAPFGSTADILLTESRYG